MSMPLSRAQTHPTDVDDDSDEDGNEDGDVDDVEKGGNGDVDDVDDDVSPCRVPSQPTLLLPAPIPGSVQKCKKYSPLVISTIKSPVMMNFNLAIFPSSWARTWGGT